MSLIKINLLTASNCHLCKDAENILKKLQKQIPFVLETIDINQKSEYYRIFKNDIPVVLPENEVICQHFIDLKKIKNTIHSKENLR